MSEPATREELAELFGTAYTQELAAEAEERWGDTDAWRQSQERTATLTKEEWAELKAEGRQITDDFAAALRAGVPVTDARVLNIAERHRRSLQWFYDCPPQLHRDIAELYVSDPRFTQTYESVQKGLAAYVREAIHANADWVEGR